MNMKFYMVPGSCTTGIHIILEHLEKLFEAYVVNIPNGENLTEEYLALNPKGTIPTLVLENGEVLTDFVSIAYYLAASHPREKLIPDDLIAQTKTIELMSYAVNHLHGQAFARIFISEIFLADNNNPETIKAQGMKMVENGLKIVNQILANKTYKPQHFDIADAALFYNEFWADKLNIKLPENCQTHYDHMLSIPVVKNVLLEEGYY